MASLVMMVMIITPAVISFNLEPRIAIVKRGPPGSYFGYSVAEHQVVERSSLRSVALVGAPRDNSSQPGTTRSVQRGISSNGVLEWRSCVKNLIRSDYNLISICGDTIITLCQDLKLHQHFY